jgi:hypothetical protein
MKKLSILFALLACVFSFGFAQKPDTLLFQIYFSAAKSNLDEVAQKELKMVSLLAADATHCKFEIKNTVENLGNSAKTYDLYKQRHQVVKEHLISLGILAEYFAGDSIKKNISAEATNVGKSKPENRRADIWVIRYYDVIKQNKPLPSPAPAEVKEFTPKSEAPKVEAPKETAPKQAATVEPKEEKKSTPKSVTPPAPAKPSEPLEIVSEVIVPNKQSLRSVLAEMRKDKKQSFKFSAEKNATITLKSGAVLYIPANSFELNGSSNSTVELIVEEYSRKSEMALAGLQTLSEGKLLEASNVFSIKAFLGGSEIALKSGKEFNMSIPTPKKTPTGFETFMAKTNENGRDWEQVTNAAKIDFALMCSYAFPDSIEKKLKIKSDDYCKGCAAAGEANKKEEKQRDKILQKYAVANCAALTAQLTNELNKRNLNAWKQEAIAAKLYEERFDSPKNAYFFEKFSLGWVSIDKYVKTEGSLAKINTEPFTENEDNIAFVVMKKDNAIVPINAKIAQGSEIYVVGIKQNANELKVSIVDTKADNNVKKWVWRKVTKEELRTALGKLDVK